MLAPHDRWFVADPANGLKELNLERWPPHRWDWERRADPKESRAHFWANEVNAPLALQGEKPLSDEEFIALRLYTGPMFVKYNGLLRGRVSTVPFLISMAERLCLGNGYPSTVHTLSAAIIKLSKLQSACTLYRAPGGALPKSFWREPRGGIEPAFMSTTTNREEAMHYARRSPSKILFEVQQGMVARGASVSWLSQYPTEEEIIFPPLTVLEVTRMKVDGTIIIAEVSPSVPKPSAAQGDEDALKAHDERMRLMSETEQALLEAQTARAREMEARHQAEKARWHKSMMHFLNGAREAQAASYQIAAEEAQKSASLSDRERDEKMKLLEQKEAEFSKASAEAQSIMDAASSEQQRLEDTVLREQKALIENMKRSRLSRQTSKVQASFGLKMLKKKQALDQAKAAKDAADVAAASAAGAGDAAAEAAAKEAYARAQAEFEEAARAAAEEAEATIAELREKCRPIVAKEEVAQQVGRITNGEIVDRLKVFLQARNVEGIEAAVENVRQPASIPRHPGFVVGLSPRPACLTRCLSS